MNGRDILNAAHKEHHGFLTIGQVADIAADPDTRLFMLLVRCGGGRFLAPAQDVAHFVGIIDRERGDDISPESDYVRDITIPAGDDPAQSNPKTNEPRQEPRPPILPMKGRKDIAASVHRSCLDLEESHSDADPGL